MKQTAKTWMLAALLTLGGAAGAQAQKAVNTGNGKTVKRITFDREQVNIVYSDGTADEGVSSAVVRWEETTTGIRHIEHSTSNIDHSVYDLQGRRVLSAQPNVQSSTFNVQRPMSAGVYIVRDGKGVRKIIKK